jgi:hypothetical protein
MKICLLILAVVLMAPASFAQDYEHAVEFGPFFDYFRLNSVDENFYGIGGRFAVNPHPNVGIEGELAYDFARNVAGTTDLFQSRFRILDGLFGVKLQSNGPVRLFGTAKAGFINFGITNEGVVGGFFDSLGDVRDGDTKAAFYPGAGLEFGGGTIGLRIEVGDLIYFADGARHNLKLSVGPQFRF